MTNTLKTNKSDWIIDYQGEFPKIILTDCNGVKQTIDINEIVLKERGKLAIETLSLIKEFLKK